MKQFAVSLLFILILAITLVGGCADSANDDNMPDRIHNTDNNSRIFSIVVSMPTTQNVETLIYWGGAVYLGKIDNILYLLTAYHVINSDFDYKYYILPQSSWIAGDKKGIAPLKLLWHSNDFTIISCPIQNDHKDIATSATSIASPDLKPGEIVYVKNPLRDENNGQNESIFCAVEKYYNVSAESGRITEWSVRIRPQYPRRLSDILGFSGNPIWHKEKLIGIIWAVDNYDRVFAIPASVIRKRISKAPIPQSLKDELLR